MRLEGKRALVTAAGQGIGRASAEAMVREGAEVFATDINMDTLGTLEGAETFLMDARDPEQITAAATRARPDILVNCAGFVHNGTILDATEEEWDFAF
ncbi:MAG: SDR family NAD(P)-dependent oxidoreductase, partial [Paracoccaceae bacterium]